MVTTTNIPAERRAVGSRVEVDFDAVAMAWRLDLSGMSEVGNLVLALDLRKFEDRVEFFVEVFGGGGRLRDVR